MRTREDSKLILETYRKAQPGEIITFSQYPISAAFITDCDGVDRQVITMDVDSAILYDTEVGFITVPISFLSDSNLDIMASAIEGA